MMTKNLVIKEIIMIKIMSSTLEIIMTIIKSTNDNNHSDAYFIESHTRNETVADTGLDSTGSTAPLPCVSLTHPTLVQHA